MTARTLVVLWRVTERCNLACAFFAYDRNLVRPRLDTPPEFLLEPKIGTQHR